MIKCFSVCIYHRIGSCDHITLLPCLTNTDGERFCDFFFLSFEFNILLLLSFPSLKKA